MCLAIPGKVTELYDAGGVQMGMVDHGGVRRAACMEYLPDVGLGEYVMVHVGFAISRLDEDVAMETLHALRDAGALDEELRIPTLDAGEPT